MGKRTRIAPGDPGQSTYEMVRAMALSERTAAPLPQPDATKPTATKPAVTKNQDLAPKSVRHWLWRMGGRKLLELDPAHVAENYRLDYERMLARERRRVVKLGELCAELQRAQAAELQRLAHSRADELARARAEGHQQAEAEQVALHRRIAELEAATARLTAAHEGEMALLFESHSQAIANLRTETARQCERTGKALCDDLSRANTRIAQLETQLANMQEAHSRTLAQERAAAQRAKDAAIIPLEREAATLRSRIAELKTRASKKGRNSQTQAEAAYALAEAQERVRLLENKAEILQDALEITRAGMAPSVPTAQDSRFRDAKRAFARSYHPDQGGRNDPEKQRLFVEFWPVLEKIERGE